MISRRSLAFSSPPPDLKGTVQFYFLIAKIFIFINPIVDGGFVIHLYSFGNNYPKW